MAIDISVGTTFGVVLGEPATFDSIGYEALVYELVGEVGAVPEFGGEAQVAEYVPLATGVVNKRPGSINYGSFTLPLAQLYDDAGQDAMISGFDGANKGAVHSFKVEKAGTGAIYFTGIITGYKFNLGDANSISQASATVELISKPLPIEAI